MGKPAYQSYLDGKGLEYRGYYIKVKQDFGRDGSGFHLIDGLPCAWGYIVTDGFCDVSPGAAWYATVADAKVAIDILVHVGGEKNSSRFWNIMRRYQERRKALDQIYHTLAEATDSYKPTVVDVARDNGANIEQHVIPGMHGRRLYKVMDQGEQSPLWWAVFESEEAAARAFLAVHKTKWPA